MDFITHVQESVLAQLPGIIQQYGGETGAGSLSQMERAVKAMTHELGNAVMRQWLERQEGKYPADEQPCPHCGEAAEYVRGREGMTLTLQGRVYYRRAYYHCPQCGGGHYPLDERLGIQPGEMSAEVIKLAALLGIQDAFAASSDTLARTTLLELSPNSIRKACQQVGEAVMAEEQTLQQRSHDLEAQLAVCREGEKPPRLYGSMDGFMVWWEEGWHEMKAGAWWTTTPNRQGEVQAQDVRYYVDVLPAEDFSELVWATGFALHAQHAHQLVFVADGAEWIWRIVQQHYPHAIQIVDWYHAIAYLSPIATTAFADEGQAHTWLAQQHTHLWEGRLHAVFRACRALASQAPDPVHKALSYFARNRTRLRYAHFRARGLQIASGTMESGCKQIGLERLKIAGAQWSQTGARKVAKARAAYLSGQWDHISAPHATLPQVA